jgi:hypothetical protein
MLIPHTPLYRIIESCHSNFFAHGLEECPRVPFELPDAIESYRHAGTSIDSLQAVISTAIQAAKSKALQELMLDSTRTNEHYDLAHRAMLLSCTGPSASIVLTTLPSDSDSILTNFQFSVAVRTRLNIVPINDMVNSNCTPNLSIDVHCSACTVLSHRPLSSVSEYASHAHTCRMIPLAPRTQRHNMVLNSVMKLYRELGYTTLLEPYVPTGFRRTRLKPDATCRSNDPLIMSNMVDVSITHPSSSSYVNVAQGVLGAASRREKEKSNKYSVVAASEHLTFLPLVMETSGCYGRAFHRLLSEMAKTAERCHFMPMKEYLCYARRSITFSFHRGNALVVSAFLSSCRINSRLAPSDRADDRVDTGHQFPEAVAFLHRVFGG